MGPALPPVSTRNTTGWATYCTLSAAVKTRVTGRGELIEIMHPTHLNATRTTFLHRSSMRQSLDPERASMLLRISSYPFPMLACLRRTGLSSTINSEARRSLAATERRRDSTNHHMPWSAYNRNTNAAHSTNQLTATATYHCRPRHKTASVEETPLHCQVRAVQYLCPIARSATEDSGDKDSR